MTTTAAVLNESTIRDIFSLCIMRREGFQIKVDGPLQHGHLSMDVLDVYRGKIGRLLGQLPSSFMTEEGDSLANVTIPGRDGHPSHSFEAGEELMLMGLALGFVVYTVDPDRWDELERGLPHFRVRDELIFEPDPPEEDEYNFDDDLDEEA